MSSIQRKGAVKNIQLGRQVDLDTERFAELLKFGPRFQLSGIKPEAKFGLSDQTIASLESRLLAATNISKGEFKKIQSELGKIGDISSDISALSLMVKERLGSNSPLDEKEEKVLIEADSKMGLTSSRWEDEFKYRFVKDFGDLKSEKRKKLNRFIRKRKFDLPGLGLTETKPFILEGHGPVGWGAIQGLINNGNSLDLETLTWDFVPNV